MAFWSSLLEQIADGGIGFTISIDKKNVVKISIKEKKIIVEVISPVMAINLGVKEFMKKHSDENEEIDMEAFENIKKAGYKIILKYGLLEIEV